MLNWEPEHLAHEEMGTYTRFHEMGIERKSAVYREQWEARLAVI